jgi:hypothetical protein
MCTPERYDVVRKERSESVGGGVAVFINKKLKYSRKNGLFDGDGKIEAGQEETLIVSCFKQPHMKIELRAWENPSHNSKVNS